MKIFILNFFSVVAFTITFAQDIRAITEDGKNVILKQNMTWHYDMSNTKTASCTIDKNFKEPIGDKENQSFLKLTNATVADMKKHVSVDLDIPENYIVLIELSEQKGNAIYILCIKGSKVKYRRSGSVFFKDNPDFYKTNN
jgi:hypothetical protein